MIEAAIAGVATEVKKFIYWQSGVKSKIFWGGKIYIIQVPNKETKNIFYWQPFAVISNRKTIAAVHTIYWF